MLRVYNGSLYYYEETLPVPSIYDRWFRVNIIHDVDMSNLKIYIDGEFKFEAPGQEVPSITSSMGFTNKMTLFIIQNSL